MIGLLSQPNTIDSTQLLKNRLPKSIINIAHSMLKTSRNCQQRNRRRLPGRRKRMMKEVSSISTKVVTKRPVLVIFSEEMELTYSQD